jgi:hypothetical protein
VASAGAVRRPTGAGARTDQETEEGARGSSAARQTNCQHVARARWLSRRGERIAREGCSAVCGREIGLTKRALAWPDFPRREGARRGVMSWGETASEEQCLPLSVHVWSLEISFEQSMHCAESPCPQSRSQSAGRSAANAIFVRSITPLTGSRGDCSFGIVGARGRSGLWKQLRGVLRGPVFDMCNGANRCIP